MKRAKPKKKFNKKFRMEETNYSKMTLNAFSPTLHCTAHVDHGFVGFKHI